MEWLRQAAKTDPRRIALSTAEHEYTYEELYYAVLHTAYELQDTLADCRRVAIMSDNSASMAVHILACMLLHKELLLLNVHLKAPEVTAQLSGLGISSVILSPDRAESVVCGRSVMMNQALHISPVEDRFDWHFPDEEVAAIMNTSATTGVFKSVPIRWGQIRAHVKASGTVLGVQAEDNWLIVLPLFHVSGLSIVMRTLYNGTAMTILEKYNEQRVLDLIHNKSVTLVSLVPTVLKSLLPKLTTHALRVILLGGEYIPASLIEDCMEKHLPLYKTYGMTETFSQSVTMSVSAHPDKKDSVGLPLPGIAVRIEHPDTDGVGEIHLTGPMVMTGYINGETLSGDFNTEDMGYIDEDGFLYILNRRKDLIISGGENIYPKELEDLVYTLDDVKECAVIPVDDEVWGQVPALFVALKEDRHMHRDAEAFMADAEERIRRYMAEHLANYKVPKYIRIVDALPRNGTGKIMRHLLTVDTADA